ncbi:MAG: triose-phosphate isomerase family protein, partial [Acidimicrobiales bacterium]
PICCVGESEEERAEGRTKDRLDRQVEEAIGGLAPESVAGMVVAYEPIWAIGTGQAATAEDAQEACSWIREIVGRVAGAEAAATVRIQYGGSVTGENTGDLMSGSDVDGLLVGGASLDASALVAIVKAASHAAG